tara:strand:- start:998 stop:1234 length:237 start_codon:yes stop_codon:yes gene_type:complete
MGKGDKKSKKGKISKGSSGVRRQKKIAVAELVEKPKKVIKKKASPKKETAKKTTAKKTAVKKPPAKKVNKEKPTTSKD